MEDNARAYLYISDKNIFGNLETFRERLCIHLDISQDDSLCMIKEFFKKNNVKGPDCFAKLLEKLGHYIVYVDDGWLELRWDEPELGEDLWDW